MNPDNQHPNKLRKTIFFYINPQKQHSHMLPTPIFSRFASRFSLRNRQPRLSLLSANPLESQSARLSTQSELRLDHEIHGLDFIKNQQQLGQVGTVGPQQMRKLDGLVDVGQELKVIRNFNFYRTLIFLGLAEPQLQLFFQIAWVPSPHGQMPMNLDVLATTPGLPSQVCTAQYHPTTNRLQGGWLSSLQFCEIRRGCTSSPLEPQ
jgi:hypothetical protein